VPSINVGLAISVIVPAYNAAHTLGACLDALQHQTAPAPSYEIIVVDDGSTDETGTVAEAAGVQLLRQVHRGPAAARNLGVSAARGGIIMFTDADCAPAPDWVEQMHRSMSGAGVSGAKGAYRTRQREIIARLAQIEFEERYALLEKQPYIDFFDAHALALDKAAFDASGGFDPFFPVPNNEDVDLAYRFSEKGYRVVFNRAAVVYHRHASSWRKYARTKLWRGYWRMQVYRRYPRKAAADSYTPQTLKLQILLLYGGLPMVPLALRWPVFGWAGLLLVVSFLLSMLPLWSLAWRRDRGAAPFMPLFLSVRGLAIGAGSILGLLTVLGIVPVLGRRQGHYRLKRVLDAARSLWPRW
jgi:glycosyltransferase involved in cell wall biosynthesis